MKNKTAPVLAPAKIILLLSFFTLLFYGQLFAYLDPGAGSYMLQLLIAGLAGALLAVKVFWNNIAQFLKKLFKTGKKGGK